MSGCKYPSWCVVPVGGTDGASSQRSALTQLRLAFSELFSLRGPDALPIYWENAHKDHTKGGERGAPEFFDDMYPVAPDHLQVLRELINATAGENESSLQLVRALRVENSALWGRYQRELARLRRKRGTCRFAGRGAPLTTSALSEVEGSDDFTQVLDEGVCEAYLWHGTRPQVALQIVHGGFQVNRHSVAGKRFGQGGYFSEDPAKADSYAGAGEGLYKDCYAMLLCRVALGKQFHTRSFRAEDATERAGSRHDSTLAEPRGASWREFVAFRTEQVYPEYALVYERCARAAQSEAETADMSYDCCGAEKPSGGLHDAMRWVMEEPARAGEFPANWHYGNSTTGCFHGVYPAEAMRPIVQALMDSTWVGSFTIDRKGSLGDMLELDDPCEDMPQGLTVLKVLRLEDSERWVEYAAARDRIHQARGRGRLLKPLAVESVEGLPERERQRLLSGANEVFLFHGSSPQKVMSIVERGFPVDLHSFNQGMFGDGAYFVESSTHADEYSEDDKDGYYRGYFAMLLCRVVLGNVQVLPAGDRKASEHVGHGLPYDSAVGEREASDGSFREFFVTSNSQIYPEYAIIYERAYRGPRPRSLSFSRGRSASM